MKGQSWLKPGSTPLFLGHKHSSRKHLSHFGGRHRVPSDVPLSLCLYPRTSLLMTHCPSEALSSKSLGLLFSSAQPSSYVFAYNSMKSFFKFSAFVAMLCHLPDFSALVFVLLFSRSQEVMYNWSSFYILYSCCFFLNNESSNNSFKVPSSSLFFLMRLGPRILITPVFSSTLP